MTPGEQEEALAAAFEALLDEDTRLDEIRAILVEQIRIMCGAVDDGGREVMREVLINVRIALSDLINDRLPLPDSPDDHNG
jgi:hypothetical protein